MRIISFVLCGISLGCSWVMYADERGVFALLGWLIAAILLYERGME